MKQSEFQDAVAEIVRTHLCWGCLAKHGCGSWINNKIPTSCASFFEMKEAILALHEQEQSPLVEALKECIETESYWHGITCASGRDPSKECDCWVNRAKQALAKIDAAMEGRK